MLHRTKLRIGQIRTYNQFMQNCAESALTAEFGRMYERAKIHLPHRVVQNGQTILKG